VNTNAVRQAPIARERERRMVIEMRSKHLALRGDECFSARNVRHTRRASVHNAKDFAGGQRVRRHAASLAHDLDHVLRNETRDVHPARHRGQPLAMRVGTRPQSKERPQVAERPECAAAVIEENHTRARSIGH